MGVYAKTFSVIVNTCEIMIVFTHISTNVLMYLLYELEMCKLCLLFIAYDPLKEEIGSWNELGSSQASSYRAYSDYESSRVSKQPL